MSVKSVRRLARAAFLPAALAAAALVAGPSALRADEIDDGAKALHDLEKAGDVGKIKAKLQELKDRNDPRICQALRDLARSKNDEIAIAAIKDDSRRKDPKLLEWLRGRLDDKEYCKKDKDHDRLAVYKAILDAIGPYRDKASLKGLEDVVKKWFTVDSEVTAPAIRSYGSVLEIDVVEQLLKWLEEADARGGGQSGKNESADARKNKDDARKVLLDTLNAMTQQELGDAKMWKEWWADHKKGFKFPDPDKKEDERDISHDPDWTDPSYNYTITRPKAAGWYFQPKDAYCRIRCCNKDEKDYEWGRAEFQIHNTTTQNPKTMEALADWWVKTGFPEQEFSEFAPDCGPKVETKKIGNRTWLVATAKGTGKNARQGWGSMERRVYMTKCDYMKADHLILVGQLVCRTGMEPDQKERLYAVIEGVTLKPVK